MTFWWFNDALFIPTSESLWTAYNQLLGGNNPGLASDLEFITVLLGSIIATGSITWLVLKILALW